MELRAARRGARLTVQLVGELDHHSAERIRSNLDHMLRDKTIMELHLDMRGVTFMDSSGLGVVLGRYKTLRARGGKVILSNISPYVDRVFRMSGVYKLCERI